MVINPSSSGGVPTPTPQDQQERVCQCGHVQARHAGPTHRGICYECYRASDSGPPGSYCSRFRLPTGSGVPTPQEPEITDKMIKAAARAMATLDGRDFNRMDRGPVRARYLRLAKHALEGALAGRTVVELPEPDSRTVQAYVKYWNGDPVTLPQEERFALEKLAAVREARRLASESRKDGETHEL